MGLGYRRIISFPQQYFDEMSCKLDSTENPHSFEKYVILPRPALEQGCGKQTPSARKLFFRVNLLYVPNIKM